MRGVFERTLRWARIWARKIDFFLARRFALSTREDRVFFLLIPLVGLLAGTVAILVQRLSEALRVLLWGYYPTFEFAVEHLPSWRVPAALVAGGVLIYLVGRLARAPVSTQGVSVLVEAVALHGGRLAVRPVLFSALASIATVGSGGSLGREGPMLRLGAAISSWLGERFGLSSHRLKILLGCGTAAGFAAAYNVPIGGSLFAMEVILGSFALEIFGPIVVASVIATLLSRAAESEAPIYPAFGYQLVNSWEIVFHFGLGIVGAVTAVVFVLGVRSASKVFQRLPLLPAGARPAVGLGLVGLIGLWAPQVLGNGFETITDALQESVPLKLLAVLAVAKLVATALTAGSGCPGGHFTASLCVGALVGGAYGGVVHALFPTATSSYGAYAAVGMAAVAAGSSRAPLSAILMLFEFTGNYQLILPLMIASIVSSLVARRLYPYSIYTEPLQRRGVQLAWRMEQAALAGLRVDDLARDDLETLAPGDAYARVVDRFLATRRQRLYVVDQGKLLGSVSLHDLKHVLREPDAVGVAVAYDLMAPVPVVLRGEERLDRAAELFARSDFERLPVVDDEQRFRGVLAKRDLLAVYAQEVLGRPAMLTTFATSDQGKGAPGPVELPPDFALRSLAVPAALVGQTLAEARLTQRLGVRVIEIKRPALDGWEWVAPEAGSLLAAGDELIVLGPSASVEALAAGRLGSAGAEPPGDAP
ncbi:MAG: chloride channel protein [Acidobacteria bacterium]|nr:chloride channel protein [Acidobacteriota bacterium]